MNKFKEWMSGKKKIFATLGAAIVLGVGHHNGWDPEMTRQMAWSLLSYSGLETLLDLAAMFKRG